MSTSNTDALPINDLAHFFRTLADETRLLILHLLSRSDMRAGELVARLQLPQNAVSYHLKQLRGLGLLQDRRSSADARDVYYTLDWERLRSLYAAVGQLFHPGFEARIDVTAPRIAAERPLRVLFLCTHNSARSQLAEGLLRYLAEEGVEAFSAGTEPDAAVHPDVLAMLADLDGDTNRYVPKGVELFAGQSFDYVITVCDRARESCPMPAQYQQQIHWSFPDPLAVEDDAARGELLARLQHELLTRLRLLLSLPRPAKGQEKETSAEKPDR